jgi:hypothetical protein
MHIPAAYMWRDQRCAVGQPEADLEAILAELTPRMYYSRRNQGTRSEPLTCKRPPRGGVSAPGKTWESA